jgi:uncharacterized Zn finger protein
MHVPPGYHHFHLITSLPTFQNITQKRNNIKIRTKTSRKSPKKYQKVLKPKAQTLQHPSSIPPASLQHPSNPQVETQAVEKEVEVPMVLRQEVIVETPQLVVAEVIREMPQEMTQQVVKEVPKFQSLELPRFLMKMGPVKYLKNPEY